MNIDKKMLGAMVNRFLGWKLPATFSPDAGIKFAPANGMTRAEAFNKPGWWPVGTNLLTADEAREMLEHVLDAQFIPDWSLLEATQCSLREHMRAIRLLIAAGHVTQEKVDEALKIATNLKWSDDAPAAGVQACGIPDIELPGMWERADFEGGQDEVRGPDWKRPAGVLGTQGGQPK